MRQGTENTELFGDQKNYPFCLSCCPQFGDRIGERMRTNDFSDYLGLIYSNE